MQEVSYGSGSFIGLEVADSVKIAPKVIIQSQSVGVAFEVSLQISKMFCFDSAL